VEGQPQHQCQPDPAQWTTATAVEQAAEVVEQATEAATAAASWFPLVAAVPSGPAVVVLAGNVPGHACSNRECGAATGPAAGGQSTRSGRGRPEARPPPRARRGTGITGRRRPPAGRAAARRPRR